MTVLPADAALSLLALGDAQQAHTGEPAQTWETADSTPLVAADLIRDAFVDRTTDDAFKHVAIARRIADLVSNSKPPVNIALFGPWGSGKSSMARLLGSELRRRAAQAPQIQSPGFIIYDAWKFGGSELRRNFISHAANELGFGDSKRRFRRFHRGLYESRRTVDLSGRGLLPALAVALLTAFILFVIFAAVAAGLTGLASVFTDEDFNGEIARTLPGFLTGAGLVTAVVGALTWAVRAGHAEVEQSAPAQAEEFVTRFRELIAEARERAAAPTGYRGYERLVFFIDELDRCDRGAIVETLIAIRTFLDEEHCVFLVAADRDVLEEALEAAPQPTPANETTPYYSSASAFLDKIFQHQIELPPLRGRRLSTYARDLVDEQIAQARGGPVLWRELREAETPEVLDNVLYALVPSHVRSPRRVKVLLNHFATSARIAQSRGVQLPERAAEIAKLVALRTEFPNFAADLYKEPRLPAFYIDLVEPGEHQRSRVDELLKRHRDEIGPDEYITDQGDKATIESANDELARAHREQLRRYLERTSEIPDAGLDLLFLEAPGEVYGLLDPVLGERIERDAPDVPAEVLSDLVEQEPETQEQAAELLSDMVQSLYGPERRRVMTVLMGLVVQLEDLRRVAGTVANSLRAFRTSEELADEHLTGALRVALEVAEADDRDLVTTVFADERLLDDGDRVTVVAQMFDRLVGVECTQVQEAIGPFIGEHPDVLLEPLRTLDEESATTLVANDSIWQAIDGWAGGATPDEVRERLDDLQMTPLDRADPGRKLAFEIQGRLLDLTTPEAYVIVNNHADVVLEGVTAESEAADHVLKAWVKAAPLDWDAWDRRLRSAGLGFEDKSPAAAAVVEHLLRNFRGASSEIQAACRHYIEHLVSLLDVNTVRELWAE